jgi:hypothetical protein
VLHAGGARSRAATPPPARALRHALHATDGYVLRPGRLHAHSVREKAPRTLSALKASKRGHAQKAARHREEKAKPTFPRPARSHRAMRVLAPVRPQGLPKKPNERL